MIPLITEEESKNLIWWYQTHKHLRSIGDGSDYRGIDYIHIHTPWVRDIFKRISFDVVSNIYAATGQQVYPEMKAMNEWEIGGVQPPHFDTYSSQDMKHNLIEETPSREWTVILYINGHESYQGGETYFPELGSIGETIQPVAGSGIVFRGIDLKHGVYPVRRGSRFTISQWFTSNYDRMITDEKTKNIDLDHVSLRKIIS